MAAILESLRDHPAGDGRDLTAAVVADRRNSVANRLTALALFARDLDDAGAERLVKIATELEDGPVLADALRRICRKSAGAKLPAAKLASTDGEVRAAEVEAFAEVSPRLRRRPDELVVEVSVIARS